MPRRISAYPRLADEPQLLFEWHEDGRVVVRARDEEGRQVTVAVPWENWFPMARQIFDSRARLNMTVELGRPG